jgi:hypothetical protein
MVSDAITQTLVMDLQKGVDLDPHGRVRQLLHLAVRP